MTDSETKRAIDAVLAEPSGKRALVIGLGVSGTAMAHYLIDRGLVVRVADTRSDIDVADLRARGAEVCQGTEPIQLDDVHLVGLSPGVDPRQPAVAMARARGIPVTGELELAPSLPCPVIGVTGTNGKSTTVTLVQHLAEAMGLRAFAGGNLGTPLLTWLRSGAQADVVVLELSSYQLETLTTFRIDVGAILNITPDHYDRYASFDDYRDAKGRLLSVLSEQATAVLNADDPNVAVLASRCRGRTLWVSGGRASGDGAAVRGDMFEPHGVLSPLGPISLDMPHLLGAHTRMNAAFALLCLAALRFELIPHRQALQGALRSFKGLAHRLEVVGTKDGVRFVNDSKATNDDAAAQAVRTFDGGVLLLAGGKDKGTGYALLAAACAGRVRQVFAFGEARERVAALVRGGQPTVVCATLEEAFVRAAKVARPGDTVLLAPACASFDAFANYAERGSCFRALVARHPGREL